MFRDVGYSKRWWPSVDLDRTEGYVDTGSKIDFCGNERLLTCCDVRTHYRRAIHYRQPALHPGGRNFVQNEIALRFAVPSTSPNAAPSPAIQTPRAASCTILWLNPN